MSKQLIIIILTTVITTISNAQNDQGFIYGTISTVDGKQYTGCIRWDDEEVFWSDFFNSQKPANNYQEYNQNEKSYQSFRHWFTDDNNRSKDREESGYKHKTVIKKSLVHVWVCQFGDISVLEVVDDKNVRLTLRDGKKIELKGGSNDINTSIKLLDTDIGELSIRWDKIDEVHFFSPPSNLARKFGEPLYGTVTTQDGDFTGLIQWDHDERLTTDKLDGDTEDGDLSIDFDKIDALIKKTSGTNVRLKSGREILLTGSNDVNEDNRGIVVTINGIGRVDISWEAFVMLKLEEVPEDVLAHYSDYSNPGALKGTVHTKDGKIFKGNIVYDLDEELDLEMIQGRNGGIEYSVPIRNIASVSPEDENNAKIKLKNGKELLLGESHDVADINSGLLVFTKSGGEPRYVTWAETKTIAFE